MNIGQLLLDAGLEAEILSGYLVATATDGYRNVFSLAELDPALNPRAASYLVACDDSLTDFPGAGFARLVFPGDNRGGRFLSNLSSLEVVGILAVPAPGALALFLSGLAVLALAAGLPRMGRGAQAYTRHDGAPDGS